MKDSVCDLQEVKGKAATGPPFCSIDDGDNRGFLKRASGLVVVAFGLFDRVRGQAQHRTEDVVFEERRVEAVRGEQGAKARLLCRKAIEDAARGNLHPSLPRSARSCL